MSILVFVAHLLAQAFAPFREYAKLVCTWKGIRALLGGKVQEHKWATFQNEFLLQLDFVDMFIAAHSIALVETMDIIVSIPGHYTYSIFAHVRRDWDFVKEVVTVTVTAVTPWPEHRAEAKFLWKGWEFAYVYDPSKSKQANLDTINQQMKLAAADHMIG